MSIFYYLDRYKLQSKHSYIFFYCVKSTLFFILAIPGRINRRNKLPCHSSSDYAKNDKNTGGTYCRYMVVCLGRKFTVIIHQVHPQRKNLKEPTNIPLLSLPNSVAPEGWWEARGRRGGRGACLHNLCLVEPDTHLLTPVTGEGSFLPLGSDQ